MRAFLTSLLKYMLLGACIGAVAGLVTAEFMPEGALGGAAIGAIIGAFFGTRIRAYRDAGSSAVRHHIEGTRSIGSARSDLIKAAQRDSSFAGGVHTGIDATERRE